MQEISSDTRVMLVAIHLCTLDQDARDAAVHGGSKIVQTSRAFGVFRRIFSYVNPWLAAGNLVAAGLAEYPLDGISFDESDLPEIYLLPAGVEAVAAIVGAK